jgi:hypothetical protein
MSDYAGEIWRKWCSGPEPPPVTTATRPFTLNRFAAVVEDILVSISNLDLENFS